MHRTAPVQYVEQQNCPVNNQDNINGFENAEQGCRANLYRRHFPEKESEDCGKKQ